ncbi:hypothetical protein BT93_L2528 [Corymbia citriodora subsp. variegata]|uniref:TIR domain-containing protein n=1 Tax=Corymbia citriodora subsp. variegata TaxID=360336 RepID=A0A8T0CJI1_CORYI|nr:hypothetical protein BT93_L2528 [Corymbia citriodora subsp. variegata]
MANLEAGSSSDAIRASRGEYQVFLSFRGPDTRHEFTDFLYHGLRDAGVHVFRDAEELPVGEVIGGNLLRAINNSMIYIPIFSRTYASSKWCLRELSHIVDNTSKSEGRKSILPIFLDVEPEDVKLKTPQYNNALLKHANKFPEEVKAWKKALAEVDEIKGWNVKKDQSQPVIIKSVVKKVLEKLKLKQKAVTEYLVGLDDKVKDLTELLDFNHRDVRLIGIYGMGGIGKTTLAKVVFNVLSSHFGKSCSFLEDVRENMSTKDGTVQLQKKLLSDIVDSECAKGVKDSEEGMRRIGEILNIKRVLVVLDDVDNKEHIKKLIGNNLLHSGSRIIITTRNTAVLQVQGLKGKIIPCEMLKMDDAVALQLFCRHAFGRDSPLVDYHRHSSEIISSIGGLPLAVEVIGSLLNGKTKAFWNETLSSLRNVPEEEIIKKLRISYDVLDYHQKQIFLDIACFFFNKKKTNAIYMWASCQFNPERGIDVLTNRCLIKILDNDRFWMHDQLIDMGRQVVRQESLSDHGKRSRLWIAKEACAIIKTKERAQNLKVLSLTWCHDITTIPDFSKCLGLERLTLAYCSNLKRIESFIGDLQWLIKLKIVFCKGLTDLPKDVGALAKLKHFSLRGCDVQQFPSGISTMINLEELNLSWQRNMKGEIPVGIGELSSLRILNLENTSIWRIPRTINMLHHLQTLNLWNCDAIEELPELPTSLTCLLLGSRSLHSIPNLSNLTNLVTLRLNDGSWGMTRSKLITGCNLRGIGSLSRLEKLDFTMLNVLAPPELASLSHLKSLKLTGLDIKSLVRLPSSYSRFRNLADLRIYWCEVEDIPLDGFPQLERMEVSNCQLLQRFSIPLELTQLRHVELKCCPKLVEIQVVDLSKSLEILYVSMCQSLRRIGGLPYLTNLVRLEIIQCEVLPCVEGLEELESLKYLKVQECPSLRRLIDASCTYISDDCEVFIEKCGYFVKDSPQDLKFTGTSLKRYVEEILQYKVRHLLH